jgi:hypothetical protein
MSTITLELDADLTGWLEAEAARRAVSVEHAAFQLLQEERMRDLGVRTLDVTVGGEYWSARMPLRGVLYTDYATEWTRATS